MDRILQSSDIPHNQDAAAVQDQSLNTVHTRRQVNIAAEQSKTSWH